MKTTSDGLLNHRLTVEQPETGYRIAMDTVFLAAAVPARAGEKVLDLGCGAGGAMLCLAARVPGVFVTGIDIQNDLTDLCRRNIARNKFDDRLEVFCGDVRKLQDIFASENGGIPLPLREGLGEGCISFDHIMINPPYHNESKHDVSENKTKRTANAEKTGDLPLWIESAARALKPSGVLTLIHRADRLDDILNQTGSFFGALEILPLLPAPDALPKRIILRAYKGKTGAPKHCRPLILHGADGRYTDAAESILRHAQALEFALA